MTTTVELMTLSLVPLTHRLGDHMANENLSNVENLLHVIDEYFQHVIDTLHFVAAENQQVTLSQLRDIRKHTSSERRALRLIERQVKLLDLHAQ